MDMSRFWNEEKYSGREAEDVLVLRNKDIANLINFSQTTLTALDS